MKNNKAPAPGPDGCSLCRIELDHVGVTAGADVLLKDVSFHIHCGQLTALVGPNGAGKTTLVQAILGQRAHTGSIRHVDAEGHTYHFVRPEALAAEKEIKDLSKDAPKEIASTELTSFSFGFRANYGSYGLDDRWPSGSYSWELEKQEDGSYRMDFRVMGDSYVALDFSDTVSAEYAEGLAKLLTELGIVAHNGYYMTNSVSKPGYSLYANYASGEKLSVRAYGDAGDTCVFDLLALLDYAAQQDLFRDEY